MNSSEISESLLLNSSYLDESSLGFLPFYSCSISNSSSKSLESYANAIKDLSIINPSQKGKILFNVSETTKICKDVTKTFSKDASFSGSATYTKYASKTVSHVKAASFEQNKRIVKRLRALKDHLLASLSSSIKMSIYRTFYSYSMKTIRRSTRKWMATRNMEIAKMIELLVLYSIFELLA